MNLRGVAIDDHIQNPLAGDHVVSRIIDVPLGTDHRNAKVADSIGVGYGTRIRQDDKWNIGPGHQPGLPGKRRKIQGVLSCQLLRTAVQFLDLLDKLFLIRVLRENKHHRMAPHITQPPYFPVHAAPDKIGRRPRNSRNTLSRFRFRGLGFGAQRECTKSCRQKTNPKASHTFMMSTSLLSAWASTSLTN